MKKIVAITCSPRTVNERHEKVFPEDKKKAYAQGEQMVNGDWEECV